MFGAPVPPGPRALIYLRSPTSCWTHRSCAALDGWLDQVDDVVLVGVCPGPLAAARDLVARQLLRFPLVCDVDGQVAERLGVRSGWGGLLRHPTDVWGAWRGLSWGRLRAPLGDGLRPVAVVTDVVGHTLWRWSAPTPFASLDLQGLTTAVQTIRGRPRWW